MKQNDLLQKIAEKINQEHDDHADLLARIKERIGEGVWIEYLVAVHKARTETLERIYELVKRG